MNGGNCRNLCGGAPSRVAPLLLLACLPLAGAQMDPVGACCYSNGVCVQVTQPMCGPNVGDVDCDGDPDFDDIHDFVLVLSGGTIPGCPPGNCDFNMDGVVDFDDINPFVALLGAGVTFTGVFLGAGVPCDPYPCADVFGDTCSPPLVLAGPLPITAFGDTCLYTHDYEAMCPFDGSLAPDLVYRYTPVHDEMVTLSLCEDGTVYDTKMYVYEGLCFGWPLACNDDACTSPQYPLAYISRIEGLPLTAGTDYYIIVDGYSSSECGEFHLAITAAAW